MGFEQDDNYFNGNDEEFWNPVETEKVKNLRIFGIMSAVCGSIILFSIILLIFYTQITKKGIIQAVKQLDFITNTYEAGEWVSIKNCDIKISDAFILYDSEQEVWMPSGKKIIGVYAEALNRDEYESRGGITEPYLSYGENLYCFLLQGYDEIDMLTKAGYGAEECLSPYGVGGYEDEEGYYFFMVDSDADTYSFIVDERETKGGRMEFIKVRNIFRLELTEEKGGKDYE